MNKITSTLHTLSNEAKAEESKIVGRHRKALTPNQVIARNAHRTAIHVFHTFQLMWIGLPAILAFEVSRPAWMRFVETPLSELMFGHGDSTTHEAMSTLNTLSTHFIG